MLAKLYMGHKKICYTTYKEAYMANIKNTASKAVNAVSSQSASKTETIKTVVCKETTSPNEKLNGAKHYTVVTNAFEILNLNTYKNLRRGYEKKKTDDIHKTWNSVHKDIEATILGDPDRLIQRSLGASIICDSIKVSSPGEYGINTVEMNNASLTNGAQTQSVLNSLYLDSSCTANDLKQINVRVSIIVEPNKDEQTEIQVAQNNSTNVSDLSKFGAKNVFDDLSDSMEQAGYGRLAKSETDLALDPTLVLMVTRLFTSDEQAEDHPELKNVVKSYRNKAIVRSDFAELFEERKKKRKQDPHYEVDLYRFYVDFAPTAWKLYLDWQQDPDWIGYWKSSKVDAKEKSNRLGKYSTKNNKFELGWAILCPVLHGLRSGVSTGSNLSFSYPKNWDKKKYMKQVFEHFRYVSAYVPQDFGKTVGTYSALENIVLKMR